jgi:hypothetical protein
MLWCLGAQQRKIPRPRRCVCLFAGPGHIRLQRRIFLAANGGSVEDTGDHSPHPET